jgi:hypothetical protein
MSLETWQWIKAASAIGQSDWHRQDRDGALCLIFHAWAARNKLTVIFKTTGESQPGISPLYLVLVREALGAGLAQAV